MASYEQVQSKQFHVFIATSFILVAHVNFMAETHKQFKFLLNIIKVFQSLPDLYDCTVLIKKKTIFSLSKSVYGENTLFLLKELPH